MTDHTQKPERGVSTRAARERRAEGAQIANYIHALSSRHGAEGRPEVNIRAEAADAE
jgi:hypothetical protein